jgi:hypothetical protein
LHVLTGPTAVGKTEWALRWAERYGAEIVSCDSLLFYRGMDIGTAKPTTSERARVRHHLIDICPVTGQMDVTSYIARATTPDYIRLLQAVGADEVQRKPRLAGWSRGCSSRTSPISNWPRGLVSSKWMLRPVLSADRSKS